MSDTTRKESAGTGSSQLRYGSYISRLPLGIRAEFDVISGALLSLEPKLKNMEEQASPVVAAILSNTEAVEQVHRLAIVDSCCDDEPHLADWFLLDRVTARLALEAAIPQLAVSQDDPELLSAIDNVFNDRYFLNERNASRVERSFELLFEKTSQELEPPREVDRYRAGIESQAPREERQDPSNWPIFADLCIGLELARSKEDISFSYENGIFQIDIPCNHVDEWSKRVVAYLVDPQLEEIPVLAISYPRSTNSSLRFDIPVATSTPLSELSLFLTPHGIGIGGSEPHVRALRIAAAEVDCHVSIRLAHKGLNGEAERRLNQTLKSLKNPADRSIRERVEYLLTQLPNIPKSGLAADLV